MRVGPHPTPTRSRAAHPRRARAAGAADRAPSQAQRRSGTATPQDFRRKSAGTENANRVTAERCCRQAVASSHRRERSERWQVVGVGPHDKLIKRRQKCREEDDR